MQHTDRFHNPHFFETALSAFAGYSAIPLKLLNRIIGTLMNCDDRMGSCRDKGRMWGRVGAWCLSWWQRDPVGISWSKQVAPQRGQAPGPLIHSTPPLVPTGRGTHLSRFDCQTSSGRWGRKRSDGAITRFDCHHSVGTRGGYGAGWGPCACPWWQRAPVGTAWSKQVAPQPGQAQGPLIRSTPPLVPTGPWAASS